MLFRSGPVIKNLPSMWKVFRSISSSEETENKGNDEQPKNNTATANETLVNPNKSEPNNLSETSVEARPKKTKNRSSGPKLYI